MARPREFDAAEALSQTMRVFWERGYRASTFADLMKAADVQKQSLYGAFGDKRSLFLKSLALYRNQVLSELQGLLREADSPFEGIARVMEYASQPAGAKNGPSGCVMANTALELGLSDPDVAVEVKTHRISLDGVLIELWQRAPEPIEIGEAFIVTAGCDKRFATCRDRFANAANFRGFPAIPGNDFIIAYPVPGKGAP